MKILIVGGDHTWSIERLYLKHLNQLGCTVELFPAQNFLFKYLEKSIINKVKYRLNFTFILKKINVEMVRRIKEFDPETVVVFKGMEVLDETLKNIKSKGISLANYNPDNPFIFTGRGSGNKNIIRNMPYYDLHFSYNKEIIHQIIKCYHSKTYFLPFGFEMEEDSYLEINKQKKINRMCFLGNPDKQRVLFLKGLASHGLEIDIHGNNWNKYFSSDEQIRIFKPVYQDDFWRTMNRYNVQLNIMRIHNLNSHNMRTFEIPGVGSIQLAPKTSEHQFFFKDGQEIFLYNSIEDCAEIAFSILKMNEKEITILRENARFKSVESRYSYFDRAKEMLEQLEKL